jgi:ribosomal protein S18 acetylase RimI-like enzyme
MGTMVEISPLTESDRAGWEVLARRYHALFGTEVSDEGYEQTWRRLLDGGQIHGIAARLDGNMAGFAHYFFHVSIWSAGNCRAYLQDLFVDTEARGRGVGRALIEWLAADAGEHGAARLYWHTTQDNTTARALYDKVGSFKGFIAYARRLNANQGSLPGALVLRYAEDDRHHDD